MLQYASSLHMLLVVSEALFSLLLAVCGSLPAARVLCIEHTWSCLELTVPFDSHVSSASQEF